MQVTLVAVFQTVLYNTPLIFLREAEVSEGQVDVVLSPGEFSATFALNYTLVSQLASVGGNDVRSHCIKLHVHVPFLGVALLFSSCSLRIRRQGTSCLAFSCSPRSARWAVSAVLRP